MGVQADPLMHSIAAAALKNIGLFGNALNASMVLWAFWKAGCCNDARHLFDVWSAADILFETEVFGLMLLDDDRRKDVGWERNILEALHRAFPVRSAYIAFQKLGITPRMFFTSIPHGIQKIAQLVDDIESAVQPGMPGLLLVECELFAKHKGQWLKVAGLEKAQILEDGLRGRERTPGEVALEFGVFVGYTAVRLSNAAKLREFAELSTVSLEVSAIHVCVARHLLDLGHLSTLGEVKPGQAKDALPCVGEDLGHRSACFCFMDHRGTIFHQDIALVEKYNLLPDEARFIADNTLNPGSPVFLWERCAAKGPDNQAITTPWSISEFLCEHEDWTAVTIFTSKSI